MNTWLYFLIAAVHLTVACVTLFCLHRSANPRPAEAAPNIQTQQTQTAAPALCLSREPYCLGDRVFEFEYSYVYDDLQRSNTWRAYIRSMPELTGVDSSVLATKRATDGSGRYWIQWDTPIATMRDMRYVSRIWASHLVKSMPAGSRA